MDSVGALVSFDGSKPVGADPVSALVSFAPLRPRWFLTALRLARCAELCCYLSLGIA